VLAAINHGHRHLGHLCARRPFVAHNVAGRVLADRKMRKELALSLNKETALMALPYYCALADPAENYIAPVTTPDYSFASTTQGRVLLEAPRDLVGLKNNTPVVVQHWIDIRLLQEQSAYSGSR
jgi:hypothetical protein